MNVQEKALAEFAQFIARYRRADAEGWFDHARGKITPELLGPYWEEFAQDIAKKLSLDIALARDAISVWFRADRLKVLGLI